MTYTKIKLFNSNGILESLKNICKDGTSIVEIEDAIEDSKDCKELLQKFSEIKLRYQFTLDRETDKKIRLKSIDCFGNVDYLEIYK